MSAGEQLARVGELELCYQSFGADSSPPLLLVMGLGAQMVLGTTTSAGRWPAAASG